MNKKEIYLRWAVSLGLLVCVVCYQLMHPAAEPTASVLPVITETTASSAAAASEEPAAFSVASEESSSAAVSEEAAASSEAAASFEAAASSETVAGASSEAAVSGEESAAATASPTPAAATATPSPTPTPTPTPTPEPATPRGPYTDGTYTGSGNGFGGKIYVSVTVKGGYITAIDVTSADGEDGPYLRDALQLTSTVIAAQSTNVDAVSGATSTSWGILDAIDNALKGAGA